MEIGKEKSMVLVVGSTGSLGRDIVRASLAAGYPTFALVRPDNNNNPEKSLLVRSFTDAGAKILKGSLDDLPSLVEAVKQVDVVICAIPSKQVLEQKSLIHAIKVAGHIKRFIPSEFGADPDKVQILKMDHDFYKRKAEIRRLVENEGIRYTYVCCNYFMSYLLPSLVQPGLGTPPKDKVKIFGDGNTKAVFVNKTDVATFTISTIDDSRTLNKVLYLRPHGNVVSMNELIHMWESKIHKKLEKVHVPENEILQLIQEIPYPGNMELIFIYSAFIKGDHTYFSVEPSGLEGTNLYPHLKYTTVSEYLDTLL